MSTAQLEEYTKVMETVRSWSSDLRLTLAEELLRSLHSEFQRHGPRGIPADQVLGIGAGIGPSPDDETIKRWIQEHRAEKYG